MPPGRGDFETAHSRKMKWVSAAENLQTLTAPFVHVIGFLSNSMSLYVMELLIRLRHTDSLGRTQILFRLHSAGNIYDMNFPGSELHPLKGKLKGRWAVKVSGNWRVVFRFERGHASEVDYDDDH